MADKVRIGFVGCGFMGQKAHLENFITIGGCEVVALAEGRTKTAEAVAKRYDIPAIYPNHREMLENADIDAVVAIMHYSLHSSIIPDIIDAGKHIFTEKPICVKASTAEEMASEAERKRLIYHVGYHKRSDPGSLLALEAISEWRDSGEMGRMNFIRATMPPAGDWLYGIESPLSMDEPQPRYEGVYRETFPEWMNNGTKRFYGSFINCYVHQFNLVRYFLGEDYEVDYADPSGVLAVMISRSGIPCTLEMANTGVREHWEEFYKICFENGKISLSLPAPMARQRSGDVLIYRAAPDMKPTFESPVIKQEWAFLEQARHFVECIREEKPTRSPASEAVKDLEVAEEYVRLFRAKSA